MKRKRRNTCYVNTFSPNFVFEQRTQALDQIQISGIKNEKPYGAFDFQLMYQSHVGYRSGLSILVLT